MAGVSFSRYVYGKVNFLWLLEGFLYEISLQSRLENLEMNFVGGKHIFKSLSFGASG